MQDATPESRCLTIVGKLRDEVGDDLLIALLPIVIRIGRLIRRFRSSEITPQTTCCFELELWKLLVEAGRVIVQSTYNALEPEEEMPLRLRYWGDDYRRKRKSPMRNLSCLFGPIRVFRFLYEPTEIRDSSLFPLQLKLGIVADVATPALADVAARLSSDLAQEAVLDHLRGERQICWGADTLRKVVRAVAEGMGEFRHEAQVMKIVSWLKQASERAGPRRFTLAAGRDGIMLPIVNRAKYKEGAAATISVYDRWGKRLGTVYLGQMPEAYQTTISDQLTRLLNDVLEQWDGATPRLVYVTDAGHHPTEYFNNVLRKMPDPHRPGHTLAWEWIVDYFHACQYISKLAEAIFGPGREATAWAKKMRDKLKNKPQGVFRVLRSAGALRSLRGLVGEESDYDAACGYLRRHAASMDYTRYRRLRIPIGSGVTEAACKIVFTQRFKRSGMKWKIPGGASILTLRVIDLSGIWDTVRDTMLASMEKDYKRAMRATPDIPNKQTTRIAA